MAAKTRKRAKKKADDPATPDVNEAFEDPDQVRRENQRKTSIRRLGGKQVS